MQERQAPQGHGVGQEFEAFGAARQRRRVEDRAGARRREVTGLALLTSPPSLKSRQCRKAFIRDSTEILSPPLIPEIRLHLASESVPLWQKTEEELGELGLEPPFWAFAWAGGQALGRFILDNQDIVHGRTVLDLRSGSGLVAIAAVVSGALRVIAADVDEFALAAIGLNCALNAIDAEIVGDDLLREPAPAVDVILVGDLFYERTLADRAFAWLKQAQ